MLNTLTINFSDPNGVYYPNQILSGEKSKFSTKFHHKFYKYFLVFDVIGTVDLKVVETIKKARGSFSKKFSQFYNFSHFPHTHALLIFDYEM